MKKRIIRLKKVCFSLVVLAVLLSPVIAFAESYHGFSLSCSCSITSRKGSGSTSGAANPYYNYVSVVVYKGGSSKASGVSRNKTRASASASYAAGGLTKAMTNHYVCDSNYRPVGSARETIVKYAYR